MLMTSYIKQQLIGFAPSFKNKFVSLNSAEPEMNLFQSDIQTYFVISTV